MVVGHRAQAAGGGLLEEQRQEPDEQRGDDGGHHVFLADQDAALEQRFEGRSRVLGDAGLDLVDVAAPTGLAEAVEEEGDAEGRHQQGHRILSHQRAQHHPLDHPASTSHHVASTNAAQRRQARRHADPARQPLRQARQRGRRTAPSPLARSWNTPEALKISTKPRRPAIQHAAISRPITTSRKAQRLSRDQRPPGGTANATGGAITGPFRFAAMSTPSMTHAQVGADDLRIVAHLVGRAVADLRP